MNGIRLLSLWFLFLSLIVLVVSCTQEESVENIDSEDLQIKHWYQMDENRKYNFVKESMDKGKIYIHSSGEEEYINAHIKFMDVDFRRYKDKDKNLRDAVINYLKTFKIDE
jgi:hypothetical protein